MELIVRPHLMSDRDVAVVQVAPGQTISEIIDTLPYLQALRNGNLAVLVNGEIEENWNRIPLDGDTLMLAARLHGSDGSTKQVLGVIAMVALTIFAPYAAVGIGSLTGAAVGTVGALTLTGTIISAGVMLVGSLAINAIFAPPAAAQTAADKQNSGSISSTYSFGSQANQVRQFGVIPRVLGRHRIVPDIAALPYTINVGNDTYFHCVYSFGYGPLALEDFKIGQNPLANYADYDLRVHELFTDPAQLELYKNDVWQDGFNTQLTSATPSLFTTRPLTETAIVDLIYPQGLAFIQDNGKFWPEVSKIKLEYRDTLAPGGGSFVTVREVNGQTPTVSRGTLNGMYTVAIPILEPAIADNTWFSWVAANGWGIPAGTRDFAVEGTWTGPIPSPGATIIVGPYPMVIESASSVHFRTTAGLPGAIKTSLGGLDGREVSPVIASYTNNTWTGEWEITSNEAGNFPASVQIPFPKASTWEIRLTSLTPDYPDSETKHLWKKGVVALKSVKSQPPLKPDVPLTIVELRIRATGQLNGSVEEFSAVATSKLRMWNGSAWVVAPTSNPAWAYLEVLQGSANSRAVSDSRVDLEKLKSWAAKNNQILAPYTQPNAECNFVVDRSYTMWELLQSIASCGRAAPSMRDNKYSVIIDDELRSPIQLFTPRNTSNLNSSRTYLDGPHALRVKWIDPLSNYAASAVTVYRTGYNENNATVFEDLDTFGLTNQEAAVRYGYYTLAQGLLRQERFTLDCDIENLVCTRGDLVYVAHDTIQVGGDSARIAAINGLVITIDSNLGLLFNNFNEPSGATNGIRVRMQNGLIGNVLSVVSLNNEVITLLAGSNLTGVNVGDLLVLGAKTSMVGQYTVNMITPASDLAATVHLEEYAPAVYTAEFTGIIPEYEPQGGASYGGGPVDQLTAVLVEYVDDEVYPRGRVRLNWVPPQQQAIIPQKYLVYEVRSDGTELLLGESMDMSFTTEPIDLWILGGTTVRYGVRGFYEKSGISTAAYVNFNLPSRATVAPPNFDNFSVARMESGLRKYSFSYNGPVPPRIIGAEIRYYPGHGTAPTWAVMTNLAGNNGTLPYATSGVETTAPPAGEWTFGIRAMDSRRVLSDTIKYYTVTLGPNANEVSFDPTPPPTPSGFVATGFFTRILVQQDEPGYSMGGGHASSRLYGAVWGKTSGGSDLPLPTFGSALLMQEFLGNTAQIAAEMATRYRLWLTWKTRAGVESVIPAGGANGLLVQTGQDVVKLLELLNGQITESQLYADLAARIDLIDDPDTVPGSVAARLKTVSDAQVAGDTAVANQLTTIVSKVATRPNLMYNGGFQIVPDMDGWTGNVAAFVPVTDTWGRWARALSVTTNGSIDSKKFPVTVGEYYVATADTFMSAGNTTPRCRLVLEFYNAAGASTGSIAGPNVAPHTFDSTAQRRQDRAVEMQAPANSATAAVRFMWTTAVATSLGIRLVKAEMGRLPATLYSDENTSGSVAAAIAIEATTRATQTGSLFAQYSVKLDVNGYVSGFGLSSTANNAVPQSQMLIRADSFAIASPAGPGVSPQQPFIVRTTPTVINGVAVPIGVYMKDTFIQNGTIVNAMIANATIQDAKIINMDAAKITTGFLAADRIQAGSISADKINVGRGTNILKNSTWIDRIANSQNASTPTSWEYYTSVPGAILTVYRTPFYHPDWCPANSQGIDFWENGPGSGAPGGVGGAGGDRVTVLQSYVSVEANKRYEFSVFVGAHRCFCYADILWFNGAGTLLAQAADFPVSNSFPEGVGGRSLSEYKRIGCFGWAPIGTAYAVVRVIKYGTYAGNSDSHMFVTSPMMAEALSAQTAFSPYQPAGFGTVITPNGITTPSLGALSANLGAITAGTIDMTGNGAGGWGYIRSPNKWLDGTWGWVFAQNPAGNMFFDITLNNFRFWGSHEPGVSANWGLTAPGISMGPGGITVSQANVIDTLQINGNAVTVPATASIAGGRGGLSNLFVYGYNGYGSPIAIFISALTGADNPETEGGGGGFNPNGRVIVYRNGVLVVDQLFIGTRIFMIQPGSGPADYQYAFFNSTNVTVVMLAVRR